MAHPGIVYLDENTHSHGPIRYRSRCCGGLNGLGIVGCLFSILGVFTFGLASPVGLGLSLLAMRRRPRFAATVGTVLGGAGTAFLALWGFLAIATFNAAEYEEQFNRTQVVLEQGVDQVEQYRVKHEELPAGIHGNKMLIAAELTDSWGELVRYDPIGEDGYLIRSSGPDKTFDTEDDLTLR